MGGGGSANVSSEEVFFVRDRMQRFMEGRYGYDHLSRFMSITALILLIVSIFVPKAWICFYIALVLIIWMYFRIFSRNTAKRYAENERFLKFTSHFRRGTRGAGSSGYADREYQREQRKKYKYFKCPKCGQKVRVPRGRGKICITCPKCRAEFIRRS